jgi:hypothetical protein
MKKNKFLEKSRIVHGYKYEYPTITDIVKQNDYIDIIFNGVLYKQRVIKHLLGRCPEKKMEVKTTIDFINSCKCVWGDKYDYSLTKYVDARTKVKIIYDGIVYEQYPNSHLNKFPVEGFLDQNIFIQKAKAKHGNKYDYSLVEFKNSNTKVKILLDGVLYEQTPHNHLKYSPDYRLIKTQSEFITKSNMIHGVGRYLYDKSIYVNDRDKLIITCPLHGEFLQRPNQHLRGHGCPSCNESKGEKYIAKFLDKLGLNYSRQHKFKDCKNIYELPFDFYIPSLRMCIEFDGIQHYKQCDFFGGKSTFDKLKINDKIKTDYCEDNYINFIRIRYDKYDSIEEILNNNILPLKKILKR